VTSNCQQKTAEFRQHIYTQKQKNNDISTKTKKRLHLSIWRNKWQFTKV